MAIGFVKKANNRGDAIRQAASDIGKLSTFESVK